MTPGFDPWVRKIPLEKGMATHSSVLAWRIPGTGEPGGRELPHVQGQGQRPRVPGCEGAGTAERSYPASEVGGVRWPKYCSFSFSISLSNEYSGLAYFH